MLITGASLLAVFVPPPALAGGPPHGARAAAMGTAFVGLADDPSAFAYNPAGLALLDGESHVYAGATLVVPITTYHNPAGQSETTDFQAYAPPHFYYLAKATDPDWRFGVGLFAPFGVGGRQWGSNGLTRYAATESLIGTLAINPTLAGRLTPSLHAGLGLDLMMVRSLFRRRMDQSFLGGGDGKVEIKSSGAGMGFNAGLHYALTEAFSIGVAYRGKIRVRMEGDLRLNHLAPPLQPLFGGAAFSTDITSSLTFPDIICLGIAVRPSRDFTITIDAEQIRWSSFRSQTTKLKQQVPPVAVSGVTPLYWRDTWTFRTGIEVRPPGSTALRAGYAYVPSPMPERTLSPAAPDGAMHHLSAGFGYKVRDGLGLDFFYTVGLGEKRNVANTILNGEYRNTTHYAGISAQYAF